VQKESVGAVDPEKQKIFLFIIIHKLYVRKINNHFIERKKQQQQQQS
jgi:hypothetical protein